MAFRTHGHPQFPTMQGLQIGGVNYRTQNKTSALGQGCQC
ncbi:hypothetical protein D082_40260 (plasmid) [Synechocystis sp. PCC 6714]|nr:hypothetical protein D082_40260 [Synechocystis sp. PCC 6714]